MPKRPWTAEKNNCERRNRRYLTKCEEGEERKRIHARDESLPVRNVHGPEHKSGTERRRDSSNGAPVPCWRGRGSRDEYPADKDDPSATNDPYLSRPA